MKLLTLVLLITILSGCGAEQIALDIVKDQGGAKLRAVDVSQEKQQLMENAEQLQITLDNAEKTYTSMIEKAQEKAGYLQEGTYLHGIALDSIERLELKLESLTMFTQHQLNTVNDRLEALGGSQLTPETVSPQIDTRVRGKASASYTAIQGRI